MIQGDRGCVFFNFGTKYIIKLFVAIYSLRQIYKGPITLFLTEDSLQKKLGKDIAKLFNVDIQKFEKSKNIINSNIKPSLLELSPYKTTLMLDGDLIFLKPFDELWQPLEEKGFLLTRFYPSPFGINGSANDHKWGARLRHLEDIKDVLTKEEYDRAKNSLLHDKIDINLGVMGYSKGSGDAFLQDWSQRTKEGGAIGLIDESLTTALCHKYPHYLADEKWNCPAGEFFRQTNLRDAHIIHYFADGALAEGFILGRNLNTWAGKIWFSKFNEMLQAIDIRPWCKYDRKSIRGLRLQNYRRIILNTALKIKHLKFKTEVLIGIFMRKYMPQLYRKLKKIL